MMTPKTQTIVTTSVIGLTIAVSLALLSMKPDATAVGLGMMAVFIAVWNGSKFLTKRKCAENNWTNSKVRHEILFAITLASLLIFGSLIATLAKELEVFDSDFVKRIAGVNIGLILIVLGNYMPKKLAGQSDSCACTTTINKSNSIQRFMGWTFVLGGLLYALAWVILDLDQAGIAIMFAFPGAIAIIFAARFAYLRTAASKTTPHQSV